MTQRTVQFNLDFNVENLNTIESLEDELTKINDELKSIDINSESFKELSKQAQQADGKLRTINDSLDGVTGPERADSMLKMADGLVGAFQIGAGASLIFGEKTSEQLEKVIAKVGGLFAAMDGVKKITEALSAANLKGVKATITGFKKSAIAAKLFGTTARAAIAATGIGLLVIGIGLLIANFDKVSAWFKKNFQPIIDGFQKLKDIIVGIGGALKAAFTGDDIKEGYRNAIDAHNTLNELKEEYITLIDKTIDGYDKELELLKLQEGKEQDILDLQKERVQKQIDILSKAEDANDVTDEGVKKLADALHEMKKLDIAQTKLNKKNVESLRVTKEKAVAEKKVSDERAVAAAKSLADAQASAELEADRLRNLEIQNQTALITLKREERYTKVLEEGAQFQAESLQTLDRVKEIAKLTLIENEELNFLAQERLRIENDSSIIESEKQVKLDNLTKANDNYLGIVLKNLKALDDTLTVSEQQALVAEDFAQEQLRLQLAILNINLKDAEVIKRKDKFNVNFVENNNVILKIKVEQEKVEQKIIESKKKQNELIADAAVAEAGQVDITNTHLEGLQAFLETYNMTQEALQLTFELMNNQAENAFLLEQARLQTKIDSEKAALDEITEYNISKLQEIGEEKEELADTEEELNDLLRDAEGDRYDDILDQLNAVRAEQNINAQAEAALKKAEAQAQFKYDTAIWQQEKAYAKGKDDQAKAEKTQAIIQGIIQTTLAVIEALPSIPLSIIAGVLGGVAVAVIASQSIPKTPVPPKPKAPEFAVGGYTADGSRNDVAGVVHAGEWVAPQHMVNDPVAGAMISTLEGMRKGYADGGIVEPVTPNAPIDTPDAFDYNKLAVAIANQPIYASWTEGIEVGRQLTLTEDRSSI